METMPGSGFAAQAWSLSGPHGQVACHPGRRGATLNPELGPLTKYPHELAGPQSRHVREPVEVASALSPGRAEPGSAPEPRSFQRRSLTGRQLECLYWVFQGKSASDIGGILGISGRVVEEHLQKACSYFGVRSRHQAAWRAHDIGLLKGITP